MVKRTLIIMAVTALLQGVTIGAQEAYNPSGVAWDANTEADLAGYRVYEKSGSTAYEELGVCTAATTELTFGAATPHPDGSYSWVVTAYDEAGNESGYSNEVSAVFDSGPPAPPTGCRTK
jgi:fibronectin type 3 domain-containing protein